MRSLTQSQRTLSHLALALGLLTAVPACAFAEGAPSAPAPTPAPASKTDSAPDTTEAPSAAKRQEIYTLVRLFSEVFERTRAEYVEPIEDKKLIQSAINGMLTSLDPHSGYLSEDELKSMQVETTGVFGGLGIEVTMEKGFVKVVSPIDDTPASKAGLQPNDFIIAIDDVPVMGMSLEDAVKKMRGTPGAQIKLMIARDGQDAFPVTLTRAVIKVESVRAHAEGNVGYLRVTSFTERSLSGLEKAIHDLKEKIGPDKVEGWVLDLRNNPGGLLDQAVGISDAFLDSGEIVSTRGRNPADNHSYSATKGDLIDGKPLVVLVNGGSASASEIVSGALQDHHRAVLMGTKSFGKGSVQSVIRMNLGAMKLTTARYYTPSGRSIQAEGIVPDLVVEPAKVEKLEEPKLKLDEASLIGALPNEHAKDKPKADAAKDASKDAQKPDDKQPSAANDYQLMRAIDLIKGISLYKTMSTSTLAAAPATPQAPEKK